MPSRAGGAMRWSRAGGARAAVDSQSPSATEQRLRSDAALGGLGIVFVNVLASFESQASFSCACPSRAGGAMRWSRAGGARAAVHSQSLSATEQRLRNDAVLCLISGPRHSEGEKIKEPSSENQRYMKPKVPTVYHPTAHGSKTSPKPHHFFQGCFLGF